MSELLTCPIDDTPLVMAADDGVFQTACHSCRREFRFTRGVLTGYEAQDARETGRHAAVLHVHVEHETIDVRDTVLTSRWPLLHRKHPITVTEQLGPGEAARIVRVDSDAMKQPALPSEPGDRAAIRAGGIALRIGLVTLFGTILAVHFYHWVFLALLPLGAVIAAGVAAFVFKRLSTRRSLDGIRLSHLQREQWLLAQLQRYRLQATDVQARMRRQSRQLADMEKLASDMASASGDYEHRLQVVRRGIEALRHHHENDRRLQTAIGGAMEMVEIEYRASRALDYLPDDAIDRLSTTIAELEAIEAENVALEAQLEANAEVHAIAPG